MKVRVLFFGQLTGITGCEAHGVEVPEGATVQQLMEVVFDAWPALRVHDASLLTAVNLTYARREEVIPPGAEVAVMPPVQGG
jgi:molybdopterin converting factor small subunit